MKGTWLLLLALGLIHPTPQQPAPHTYRGAVQAVRARTRDLDVLTGVGEVMRVVHIRVDAATQITAGDRTVALAELVPGDIVRADCRKTDAGLVADRIEKLGHLGPDVTPGPNQP